MACSGNLPVRVSAFSGEEIPLSSDKGDPYISKKHVDDIKVLNSSVTVFGSVMNCPELSALYVYKSIRCHSGGESFKVYDFFTDARSLRRAAPRGIFALYDCILNKSPNKCITVCSKFGCFLHEVATGTAVNSQRLFLLSSCCHVMALRVVCKLKTNHLGNEELTYVVHVFDPNKTNVTARSEVSDPRFFLDGSKFSLDRFIDINHYTEYFNKSPGAPKENELMICECCDSDLVLDGSLSRSKVGMSECLSKLETLSHGGISECVLHHLMESGLCTKNIVMMSEKLSLLPSNVRETVILGRCGDNVLALHAAFNHDRHHSMQAYCYLLDSLSEDEQVRLLPHLLITGDESKDVESGLALAMQEGCADSINAFASFLDMLLSLRFRIPASRLADMIFKLLICCGKSNDMDNTGLFLAMREGCPGAVSAFGNLIDRLIDLSSHGVPVSKIVEMVFTILNSDNGEANGLFMAMQEGHSSAVSAFGELLDRLVGLSVEVPELGIDIARMVFTILMSVNYEGVTGLSVAMRKGDICTICSFSKLLERLSHFGGMISGHHLEGMIFDILLARSGCGATNALFEALKNDRANSIKEYFHLLGMISQSRWPDLLAAKNVHGVTGILFASEETVSFYLSMLKGCTIDVLLELLSILENVRYANGYAELASSDSEKVTKYENFLLQLRGAMDS